ncbi:hypothetical protein NDU88_002924 [Pleurodeles waltl]|uniref:Uncharacterized protein n=1 Tax=Pleurodeles waltl TaxID=8319 RepID=A0AAV7NK05_PLEWA|nr:hypothetical protein NDU88_002924 [Pleurodeles waltl]
MGERAACSVAPGGLQEDGLVVLIRRESACRSAADGPETLAGEPAMRQRLDSCPRRSTESQGSRPGAAIHPVEGVLPAGSGTAGIQRALLATEAADSARAASPQQQLFFLCVGLTSFSSMLK